MLHDCQSLLSFVLEFELFRAARRILPWKSEYKGVSSKGIIVVEHGHIHHWFGQRSSIIYSGWDSSLRCCMLICWGRGYPWELEPLNTPEISSLLAAFHHYCRDLSLNWGVGSHIPDKKRAEPLLEWSSISFGHELVLLAEIYQKGDLNHLKRSVIFVWWSYLKRGRTILCMRED